MSGEATRGVAQVLSVAQSLQAIVSTGVRLLELADVIEANGTFDDLVRAADGHVWDLYVQLEEAGLTAPAQPESDG